MLFLFWTERESLSGGKTQDALSCRSNAVGTDVASCDVSEQSNEKGKSKRRLTMEIGDVLERIKRSAKLRLGWFAFEDGLIEFAGTEKGSLIAENVLTEALGELSLGKATDEVAARLNAQFRMLSVQTDVGKFVAEVEQECKAEIDAFVQVRTMDSLGLSADEIFSDLEPKLLSLAVETPTGEEGRNFETRLIDPIIQSGKKRFDYQSFVDRAVVEDPAEGEARLGRVFECALALYSEIEESETVVKILKSRMKTNTYPSWLSELVDVTMQNCKRERCALMAMNIGFCKGLSIDELEKIVFHRLNN